MLERNILKFTWTYSRPAQIYILFIVLLSMPTYFMSLDLPKQIVNGPILGQGFDTAGAEQTFMRLSWTISGEEWVLFDGFQLERLNMLFALSGTFLTLIIVNGLFKFYINTYKGRLGERMLRRIRFSLVDRMLRFPVRAFRRIKSSEMASMVKDEVEPIGGFMGDAFVQPLLLGGQAITAMTFIMVQNVYLGLIAMSMIAIQFIVIPRMRRHLIRLGRERQITARKLAGRVGEIVDGITHVHVNDTSHYERADISSRLAKIFYIRYELFQRKFFAKFLNNLLAQITPFLFYVVGGYFALQGKIDVGQLVAVIAAYKDLPSPIKELIDWDQQRLDVEVKYTQVVEQFDIEDMLDENLQALSDEAVPALAFPIEINNLTVTDDTGTTLLSRARLRLSEGTSLAIVGPSNSGADVLADSIVRLYVPDAGSVNFGGTDLFDIGESVLGRRVGYAASDIFLPQGSLRDALLYALKHQPVEERAYEGPDALNRQRFLNEAEITANSDLDIDADWLCIDNNLGDGIAIHQRLVEVLCAAGLEDDVFDLGLRGKVDPDSNPQFADKILAARKALRSHIDEDKLSELVELFDPQAYAVQATIGENLLFGTPVGDEFATQNLAQNEYLRSVLRDAGLEDVLLAKGIELAETTIGLFQDLPPDHEFFNQITFMDAERLPEYAALLKRARQTGDTALTVDERYMLIELTFSYVEAQHRMGLVDEELQDKVLDGRKRFKTGLPVHLADSISFYDPDTYNVAASVQDNLLMGRVAHGIARGPQRVFEVMSTTLKEMQLRDEILDLGMEFDIGSAGKRLSSVQRQKLGLARALIKQPDLLILNRPLSALDGRQQAVILGDVMKYVARQSNKPAVVWVVSDAALASDFDEICVMAGGKILETGKRETLLESDGAYSKVLAE
ncbi:MAG: ABC transporter transmembrane domain-containing protein [Anderseniella sp.]